MVFNHCSVCMCMCVMYVTYLCIYILCIGLLHHVNCLLVAKKFGGLQFGYFFANFPPN